MHPLFKWSWIEKDYNPGLSTRRGGGGNLHSRSQGPEKGQKKISHIGECLPLETF